jgi:AcrR family transcriptional regulator
MSKMPNQRASKSDPARDRTQAHSRGERAAAGTAKPTAKPMSNRAERAAERREAIVAAALDEFVARGFAATRLDDVAKRAGVAKGTIYLHFQDKEALFVELVRTAIVPLIAQLAPPEQPLGSVREALERFALTFIQEVATTRRGDIVRLIVAEGPRFPAIADFYYREVVSRGLAAMRGLIQLGIARGEIRVPALANYPQIVVAPAMIAVIWKSLFERHAPLDAMAMLRVHLDLIFGERSAS